MKKMLFSLVFCFPLMVSAQVVDSVEVVRVVDSLIQVSLKLTEQRDFDRALQTSAGAEKLALEKLGRETSTYGSACSNHGRVLDLKKNFTEAEKWYLEAKTIREKVLGKEHPHYAWSLNNLASLYATMGNYKKSELLFLEAKVIQERTLGIEHSDYAGTLNNLAIIYSRMNNYEQAEPLYLQAKAIRWKLVDKEPSKYAATIGNLAILYKNLGNYEKAEPLYLESHALRAKSWGNQNPNYAKSLHNLAVFYTLKGDYEKAEPLFLETKSIQEKVLGKSDPDYASTLNGLANYYSDLEIYEKAEPLYLHAITIVENSLSKEHSDYILYKNNLANLYKDVGAYNKAEKLHLEILEHRKKKVGEEHLDYATSLGNLANLYRHMGNYEKAEILHLESIAILEKNPENDSRFYASAFYNIANLYHDMRNYEKAEHFYQKALSLREKILGKEHPEYLLTMRSIANMYLNTGFYDKAAVLFVQLENSQQALIKKAIRHLSEKEMNKYIGIFNKSTDQMYYLAQIDDYKNSSLTSLCYDNSLFRKSIILNSTSRIKHFARTDSVLSEKLDLLISYGSRLAAEYSKPVALRDSLIPEFETKSNEIEKYLARNVTVYGEAIRQIKWNEVQKNLNNQEAAIEFVHFECYEKREHIGTLYAALLLRPGWESPKMVYLCEQRQLDSLLNTNDTKAAIQNIYAQRDRRGKRGITPGGQKLSAGLYQLLWQPLDSLLDGVTTVHYSPSGSLHRLAFDAIQTPIKGGKGGVLADRYQLNQLFSTRSLVVKPVTSNATATAALFGGITYEVNATAQPVAENLPVDSMDIAYQAPLSTRLIPETRSHRGDGWQYLPGTRQEVEKLDALFAKHKIATVTFTGAAATEEEFKALGTTGPSPAILHIATHGFFFPDPALKKERNLDFGGSTSIPLSEHPLMRSGLLLAGANKAWKEGKPFPGREDGILTAYEIAQVNLTGTKLAVLSACETGLGDIQGTEGVMGLQRAFKMAGVEKLIVSLWPVQDIKTAAFMNLFYTKWLSEGKEIRDAFYETQQWMRKKYKDPEVWAGFVLVE